MRIPEGCGSELWPWTFDSSKHCPFGFIRMVPC